jgi:hypothetical protein
MSIATIESYLTQKLSNTPSDIDSDGGEEGMFSLFRGITTPEYLNESKQAGLFRSDASLNVVFVSDENDICAVYPAGVTRVPDPEGLEQTAYVQDCEGLAAQGLTAQLKNLKGTQPLIIAGIIYSYNPVPAGNENEIGYGYTDMIALNNGITIDLRSNIAVELGKLGEFCQNQTQNQFTLAHTGVISSTVKVTVDDKEVHFRLEGNKVIITDTIPAGGVVRIMYCVKSGSCGCGCDCDDDDHHHSHHGHHHDGRHHEHDDDDDDSTENTQGGGTGGGGPVLHPSPEIGQ